MLPPSVYFGKRKSMDGRGRSFRSSMRSRGSTPSDIHPRPREKIKDCCRKLVAFMCTQVGVGGLVVGYTLVGAVSFMKIETRRSIEDQDNYYMIAVSALRNASAQKLWEVASKENTFDKIRFALAVNRELVQFQKELVEKIKHGYSGRSAEETWTFPAALMFSLSIITMVGYGNLVPRTRWGKGLTVLYAVFGIPLYVLYFMNMGKILAGCFRWLYTWLYECSTERDEDEPPRRIIVPSTACLWVIGAYVLTGTIMFAEWEKWSYLDSTYFCVTSLCKLGLGDLVPGADILAAQSGNQTKLVINFVYMLVGLGLVAMCYNLTREEVRVKVKELREDMNQCLEDTRMRLLTCCNRCIGTDY